MKRSLFISEVFSSISGEIGGFSQGAPATFVRFAGCNLKCDYCDAVNSQDVSPNQKISLMDLIQLIDDQGNKNVVLTGGEPMLQKMQVLSTLVDHLTRAKGMVSIETNGSLPIPLSILRKATIVMDYKLNYINEMKFINFITLKSTDFVKFVIGNKIAMGVAMDIHRQLNIAGCQATIAYSPLIEDTDHISYEIKRKANIILSGLRSTGLYGVLNLQIHKLIGQR